MLFIRASDNTIPSEPRQGTAAQTGTGAAGYEGDAILARNRNDACYFLATGREYHGVGKVTMQRTAVAFIRKQLLGIGQHVLRPDDFPEFLEYLRFQWRLLRHLDEAQSNSD